MATKAALAAAVPLAHLLLDMLLALATDVSDTNMGGVLQQKPLGFFSRRLTAKKANYSTFNRELLAAQAAFNHFLPLVEGRQFQLWTDHKPLVAAMTRVMPQASGWHLAFIAKHMSDVWHTLVWTMWWPTRSPPLPPQIILCRSVMWQRQRWRTLDCRHWT
jgi:RNase H-like domain found in reverse transcriptase